MVFGFGGIRKETHLGDTGQWSFGFEESVSCGAELGDLVVREDVCPCFGVGTIFFRVPDGWAGDLFGELLEGNDMLIEGVVLTGCL